MGAKQASPERMHTLGRCMAFVMNKFIQKVLLLLLLCIFSDCNFLNYNAEIKMTEEYISNSRGLTNGVRFEKLLVKKIGENGYPVEYTSTLRFQCYNPGVNGVQEYWPSIIYFKKVNGHYLWKADTVNIDYVQGAQFSNRKRIDENENKTGFHFDEMFLPGNRTYETNPINFEIETWYYLDFQDPTLNAVYLYIDSQRNFNFFKVNSGVSPI